MKSVLAFAVLGLSILAFSPSARPQSLGNAGTIEGTAVDPSGAAVPKATVTIHNPLTGYNQSALTDSNGSFRLVNIPPNPYHLEIKASGFNAFTQDVDVRGSVPARIKATLALAGSKTSINVEAAGADLLEVDPSAHVDADRNQLVKLPVIDPGSGLSKAIVYTTGGVADDGNGFFHPLGDHAQVSFVIDGQPISDQQSKVFSTQLPTSAVQSMEVVTGAPLAEFGDKTSLVANITTRSGLGLGRLTGNVDGSYGTFGTAGGSVGLGYGTAKVGNFLAVEGTRSGRFLDTPEFVPYNDIGNNESLFDRFDFQPTGHDVFHLNLFLARNNLNIPNNLDQQEAGQAQSQRVLTWNIAPGYQRTISSNTLLTINPYVRKDQFNYYPSSDPFNDLPTTQAQQRQLLNWGVKADVSTTKGHHTLKYGMDLKQTRLLENFQFGVTDPTFNPVCVDGDGNAAGPPTVLDPNRCDGLGLTANPNLNPGLIPYDLSRGGQLFNYHATGNVNQYAFYVEDTITAGHFVLTPGFRFDRYAGQATATSPQPRLGIAYNIKNTSTVLRVAYSRTMETPFNENLLLSSATGIGGLAQNVFGSVGVPLQPGNRNQFNGGLQQAIGRYLVIDVDYFWKYTHGAYDFNTLGATTITFPIVWHNSKLDGVTGRVSTTNMKGFQAYWTFGHTRARYYPPEDGGLIFQGAPLAAGVFRIDHDQAFQSTAVFRYQHKTAEWIDLTWRYDSGLVVSGVPDAGSAMIGGSAGMTPNQQVSIGLACNGVLATVDNPISDCVGPNGAMGLVTSKLLTLPQGGYDNFASLENDDHNPDRVKPRNVFNLGIGTDNLFHKEGNQRIRASVEIANLTNRVALYNFLSTFSGTHFLQPRMVVARIGFVF
jgi:Carboxypeptidase regulatory-like domain